MYLILADLDQFILPHVDPPTVLTVSEVNHHYNRILQERRYTINQIQNNFVYACKEGSIPIAKWIIDRSPIIFLLGEIDQIGYWQDHPFTSIGKQGNILLIQLLHETFGEHLSIHTEKELLFRTACENGQLALAQEVLRIGELPTETRININADYEYAFIKACVNHHTDVAKWLYDLHKHGYRPIGSGCKEYCPYWVRMNASVCGKELLQHIIEDMEQSGDTVDYQYMFDNLLLHSQFVGPYYWRLYMTELVKNPVDIDVIKYLIECGEKADRKIDIHRGSYGAIRFACEKGRMDIASYLIELGNDGYGKFDQHTLQMIKSALRRMHYPSERNLIKSFIHICWRCGVIEDIKGPFLTAWLDENPLPWKIYVYDSQSVSSFVFDKEIV